MDDKQTCTARPAPESVSEVELIARAQRGEEAAFFALYELHKARVYSICLHLAGAAEEAERLTRNIFLCVFRKISVIRDDGEFSALLEQAAVRAALAVRRALAHKLGSRHGDTSEAKQGGSVREEPRQRHPESSFGAQREKPLLPQFLKLDTRPCFWN